MSGTPRLSPPSKNVAYLQFLKQNEIVSTFDSFSFTSLSLIQYVFTLCRSFFNQPAAPNWYVDETPARGNLRVGITIRQLNFRLKETTFGNNNLNKGTN